MPPPGRRKSPSGASARRERRRQTLAGALLTGKKISQVAKAEGVTRTYASHEANAPETRLLMAELLQAHRERIAGLVSKSLDAIEDALQSNKVVATIAGPVDAGPDPFARLTGVKRLIEMVQACRTDATETKPLTITWEMFLNLYPKAAK